MNTLEINYLLSDYSCYIGTYPRDLLPYKKVSDRSAIIINTDDSSNPGQHWVPLFLDKGIAEYFDSFGFKIIHNDILKFLNKNNIKKIIYNNKQLQSVTTSTCGAYCVLFVKFRCNNYSFCDFIHYFSNNTINNDLKASLSFLL